MKNKIKTALSRLKSKKSYLVILATAVVVIAISAWYVINNQEDKQVACTIDESQIYELSDQRKNDELVSLYQDKISQCADSQALSVNSKDENALGSLNNIDYFRKASFGALSNKDLELSKKIASQGVLYYEAASPQDKKIMEQTTALDDLRLLQRGDY